MAGSSWPRMYFIRVSLFLVLMISMGRHSLAEPQQSDAVDRLKQRSIKLQFHARSLAEVAATLSDSIGVDLVIDGADGTKHADLDFDCSVWEALNLIADTYDYNWTLSKHGVVLMTKRYHDPENYPQSHLDEMKRTSHDAVDLINSIPFDHDRARLKDGFHALADGLTSSQLQTLKTGASIHFGDLAPNQQNLTDQIVLINAFGGTYDAWLSLRGLLDAFSTSYLTMTTTQAKDGETGAKYDLYSIALQAYDKHGIRLPYSATICTSADKGGK